MLHQLFQVDRTTPFIVACSGGADSMAVVDFYRKGGKNFQVAYFNHGTALADKMELHVQHWCKLNQIPLLLGEISPNKIRPKDSSPEEYWRDARYEWLLNHKLPVVTAHHMNDVAETWIFSALHGTPKLIQAKNGAVYRPFLLNAKADLVDWCVRNEVEWVEDSTNLDVHFPRNRIRHNILPESFLVNPGLLKVLKKKYPRTLGKILNEDHKQEVMFKTESG